jgi:hypothetical protein
LPKLSSIISLWRVAKQVVSRFGRERATQTSQAIDGRALRFEPLEKRRLLSVNVTTARYDLARDGANTSETILTPSNVNTTDFGKIATMTADAQIYTQPLIVTGVAVPGYGTRNVVYVATENDTVYAFDAQGNNPAQGYLWKTSLLDLDVTEPGETAVPESDINSTDITPILGVTGTPVIDSTTNTIYVVGFFIETNGTYQQRLYALDITDGAVKFGGPATIAASVAGSGTGASGGVVTFSAKMENQRPALTLANGQVYIAYSSHGDINPWHGWVIGYSATTLAQEDAFCLTPNGDAGGVWMSGGGIAVDSSGNLYLTTGNGNFDANSTTSPNDDYGMALLKLSPSLVPEDYFAPYNQASLSNADLDYGCSDVILLTNQSGSVPNEVLSEGKWGTIYLNNSNTGSLGEYNANGTGPNTDLGEASITGNLNNTTSDVHNTIAYWNGYVYSGGDGLQLEAFAAGNGTLGTTPTSESSRDFGTTTTEDGQGAGLSVSSNGTSNGILWALDNSGFNSSPAVLYAYSATNLSTVLWTSSQAVGGRDTAVDAVKFQTPVVANGFVYVAGVDGVTIYGLLPTVTTAAAASPSPVTSTTTNLSVSASDPGTDASPTYTWAATSYPSGATPPTYSVNGSTSSNNTTATFYKAGSYTFTCTITDPTTNASTTSSVSVTVIQTLTSGLTTITPSTVTVVEGGSLQFLGGASDQFGNAMAGTAIWSVNSGGAGGTVDSNGIYTAPSSVTGTDTVTATSGSQTATAMVTVVAPAVAATQVNLSNFYNRDGIVADGSTFSGTGGLDSDGSALSGNLLGTTEHYNGYQYVIAPSSTTVNNVVYAAGQTITLPQGNYSELELLADHTNGSLTTDSLTVTYTDNSTQTFSQSFSDWYSGTANDYNNETIAVTMGYRDTSTGTEDARTFYVYNYQFALNTTKTIKSITLPSDTNLEVLAMDLAPVAAATQVSLSSYFNRVGIVADSSTFSSTGGYDGVGGALSGTLLGTSQPFNGSTFTIPAASTSANNVISATGQTITLPQGNDAQLELLADGVNGNQTSETLTVTYTDTSTQTFTQTFGDWDAGNNGYSGQSVALRMSYKDRSTGGKTSEAIYLFGYDLALNTGKTIKSLTLPSDSNLEIVAIDLTTASPPTTVAIITPAAANPSAAGTSTALSVSAADPVADAAPTYNWAAALMPSGATAPTFSVNNSASANSTTATITQAGTYGFIVTVTDPTTGNSVYSSAKVVANFGIFSSSVDIGSPSPAGALTYSSTNTTYTQSAGGSGIGGTSDQFHYTYESFSGSGQITAYVASLSNSNAAAEAGPMFRDSTAANGAFAEMVATPSDGVVFQWRSTDGGSAGSASVTGVTAPVYLRLSQSSGQFSGYYSTNGTTWTQVGSTQTVSTSSSELLGLAVTSNSSGTSATGVINTVSINAAPTVATPAAASPSPVISTTANLSVLGADPTGESNLTYTWATTGTPPATVTFSANGTNAAKNNTATFNKAGSYNFKVTITNSSGLSVTSTVSVTVQQTLSSISVTPNTAAMVPGGTQQFSATGFDQFGTRLSSQPTFTWASSVGSINSGGMLTAPSSNVSGTVTATASGINGTSSVTVTDPAPTVVTPAAASPSTVTAETTALAVLGTDDEGQSTLTYTWATTGSPPSPVTFSVNGTNAAQNTTATFAAAGTYNFTVTITNTSGLTVTSSTSVTVNQTYSGLSISPTAPNLTGGSTQQFTATALDQFSQPLASQPAITWTLVSGPGTLSSTGLYTPPFASGSAVIEATGGGYTSTATVTFTSQARWNATTAGTPGSSWTTSGNWIDASTSATLAAPGVRGLTGDTVLFASAPVAQLDGASPTLAGVTFNSSTTGYGITQGSGGSLTLQGSGGATVSVLAGAPVINAPVHLASNTIFSAAASTSLSMIGPIDGSGSLTMTGSGKLILDGANTFNGLAVQSGTVVINGASGLAIGSSLIIGSTSASNNVVALSAASVAPVAVQSEREPWGTAVPQTPLSTTSISKKLSPRAVSAVMVAWPPSKLVPALVRTSAIISTHPLSKSSRKGKDFW